MSKFKLLVEETLTSIKAKQAKIEELFILIKNGLIENLEELVNKYNNLPVDKKEVWFDVYDNEIRLITFISYAPDIIKAGTICSYSYEEENHNQHYIDIYLDREKVLPKQLLAYINTKRFELILKHELLHYLDEKQSNYNINKADDSNIKDEDERYRLYINRPEEIHTLLYSVLDLLKDKKVKFNTKKELVDIIYKLDSSTGETLEAFLLEYGSIKNVNKFMSNLYNNLS